MITQVAKVKQEEVIEELIRVGIDDRIASNLAFRYYNNELTIRDLEFLKENLKLELNNKIDSIKRDIKDTENKLNNKIDTVRNELNSRFKLHNWMIGIVITLQVLTLGVFGSLLVALINKIVK